MGSEMCIRDRFGASGQIIEPLRQQRAPEPQSTLGEKMVGGIEATGSTLLGGAAGMAGGMMGNVEGAVRELVTGEDGQAIAEKRMQQFSAPFAPVTEVGQEYAQAIGELAEPLGSLPPIVPQGQILTQLAKPSTAQAVMMRDSLNNPAKHLSLIHISEPTRPY